MSEQNSANTDPSEIQDAKQEAADRVVERVESWHEGAETETLRQELEEGMTEAQVDVDDADLDQAAQEIHDTGEGEVDAR